MFRKTLPYLLIVVAVLLDTAIIPVFYAGILTIPLTLVVTFCVSLTLGKVRGLLLGTIGGLLIDITAGSLGTMTFYFLITGFLVDLILDTGDPTVRRVLSPRMRAFRAGVIFALYELGEIVFLVHRYFVSNSFEWRYVRNMTFRGALFTAITLLLIRPLSRMFLGKRGYLRSDYGKTREVKHF